MLFSGSCAECVTASASVSHKQGRCTRWTPLCVSSQTKDKSRCGRGACASFLLSSLPRTNGPALSASYREDGERNLSLIFIVTRQSCQDGSLLGLYGTSWWLHSPLLFCTPLFVHLPCHCATDFCGHPSSCLQGHPVPGKVTHSHQG